MSENFKSLEYFIIPDLGKIKDSKGTGQQKSGKKNEKEEMYHDYYMESSEISIYESQDEEIKE